MATSDIAIRLSVVDGGKVRAEFKETGQAGEAALKGIADAGTVTTKSISGVRESAAAVRAEMRAGHDESIAELRRYDAEHQRFVADVLSRAQTIRPRMMPKETWLDPDASRAFVDQNGSAANPFANPLEEAVAQLDHTFGGVGSKITDLGRTTAATFESIAEGVTNVTNLFAATEAETDKVRVSIDGINPAPIAEAGDAADEAAGHTGDLAHAADVATLGMAAAASRAGVLGSVLARLGPVGLSAAAALGSVWFVLDQLDQHGGEVAREIDDINRHIQWTGNAAGVTAEEVNRLANELARTTLATDSAVRAAGKALIDTGTVPRQHFESLIRTAQVLTQTIGGDLVSNTKLLARAFAEPDAVIDQLNGKVRVLDDTAAREIKTMHDAGNEAGAAARLFEVLNGQLKASADDTTTLTGGVHDLQQAWHDLLVTLGGGDGQRTGVGAAVNEGARRIAGLIDGVRLMLGGGSTQELIAAKRKELTDAETQLAEATVEQFGKGVRETRQKEVDRLRSELGALEQQATVGTGLGSGGQNSGANDRATSQVIDRQKKTEAEILKLTRSRIDTVKAWEKEQIEWLEARQKEGADPQKTADAIAAVRREASLKVSKIQKEEGADGVDAHDAIMRQIDALRDERDALGLTARERAQHTALVRAEEAARRAGTSLTREEAEAIQYEAGALYDAKEAQDRHTKAMAEGKSITEATLTPTERYNAEMKHLADLLNEGAIGWDVYQRAGKAALDEMENGGKRSRDIGHQLGLTFESAFERAAVGGEKVRNVLSSLAADLAKLALRKSITEPLFNSFSGLFSGAGGLFNRALTGTVNGMTPLGMWEGFHTGGIVGAGSAMTITAPASVFDGAPRYHTGGFAGLAPGEVPAILKRGEGVFTPEQMAALGGSGAVINNNVTVNVEGGSKGDPQADAEFAAQIGRQVKDQVRTMIVQEMRQQMRPGGLLREGM